jgi:serine/threonine kinase PknH
VKVVLTMAHDVMISHSHADKPAADAACAALEARGIRCWIAPRDINPGQDWAASIVEAIRGAQVMLLVFSRNANQSPQVQREVGQAANSGKVLLPLRIEDVSPEAALEYYLGSPHWLDAITPPFEAHLEKLADACASLLAVTGRSPQDADRGSPASDPALLVTTLPTQQPSADHRPPMMPWWRRQRRQVQVGLTAAIVVILAATGIITGYLRWPSITSRPSSTSPTTPAGTTTTTPAGPPPVAAAALDGLLLSPAEINATMGATGMTVDRPWNTLNDEGFNNPSSPPECIPLGGAAEAAAYAGSGWTAFRGQTLKEPQQRFTHGVDQGVVLFPSAQAAAAFVSASTRSWAACTSYMDNVNNVHYTVGPVSTTNGTLTAMTTRTATATVQGGWVCQRALTARNNVVIDVTGCSFNTTEQGVSIADQIAAKVPT